MYTRIRSQTSYMCVYFLFLESKPSEVLRDEIAQAIIEKDKYSLETLISECEKARYPELGRDLSAARDALESLGYGRGG